MSLKFNEKILDENLLHKKIYLNVLDKTTSIEDFINIYRFLEDENIYVLISTLNIFKNRLQDFPPIIENLIPLYKHENLHIKSLVLSILSSELNEDSVYILVSALGEKEEILYSEAINAFLNFGILSTPYLISVLIDGNAPWHKKDKAALSLSLIYENKQEELLYELTPKLTPMSENIQFTVVRSFRDIGNNKVYEYYKKNLNISSFQDRNEIKRLLKNITQKEKLKVLMKLLEKKDIGIFDNLIDILATGEENFDTVIKLEKILKSTDDNEIRSVIILIMGLFGNELSVPVLAEFLRDPDTRIRANAVDAITEIGVDYTIELIKPLLNDFDNRVRANAAKGLWKLGGLGSLNILRDMINDEDRWMRSSAAYALGEIGVMQVVEILLPALHDSDRDVQLHTIRALIKTNDNTAIEAIINVIRDKSEDQFVRKNAIICIGKSENKEGLEFLRTIISERELKGSLVETASIVLEELSFKN